MKERKKIVIYYFEETDKDSVTEEARTHGCHFVDQTGLRKHSRTVCNGMRWNVSSLRFYEKDSSGDSTDHSGGRLFFSAKLKSCEGH